MIDIEKIIGLIRSIALNPCIGGFCSYREIFIRDNVRLNVEYLSSGTGVIVKKEKSTSLLITFMDDPGCMLLGDNMVCWFYEPKEFVNAEVLFYDYINDIICRAKVIAKDRKFTFINTEGKVLEVTSYSTTITFYPNVAARNSQIIGTNLISLLPLSLAINLCLSYNISLLLLNRGFPAPYSISIAIDEIKDELHDNIDYLLVVGGQEKLFSYIEPYVDVKRVKLIEIPLKYLGRGMWITEVEDLLRSINKMFELVD